VTIVVKPLLTSLMLLAIKYYTQVFLLIDSIMMVYCRISQYFFVIDIKVLSFSLVTEIEQVYYKYFVIKMLLFVFFVCLFVCFVFYKYF